MKPSDVKKETWKQTFSVNTKGGWTLSVDDEYISISSLIAGGKSAIVIPRRVWNEIVSVYSLWKAEGAWGKNETSDWKIYTPVGKWQFWLDTNVHISPSRVKRCNRLGISFSPPETWGMCVATLFFKRRDFDAMVKWYQTDQD